MFLIVLFLLGLSSVILVFMKRDKQTFLNLGLCSSFICMYTGIIIYLAKTGGMSSVQKNLLFFNFRIQSWFSYLAIPLKKLGYAIAIGRYLFPGFLLLAAIHYSMVPTVIRWRRKSLFFMAFPLASLILYYPSVFTSLSRDNLLFQKVLMKAAVAWILLYVAAAVFLLVYEYRSITIPYCKKQFRYIMLFIMALVLLYAFYCIQDPIQVYQMYSAEYIRVIGKLYTRYMTASMGMWGLALMGAATTALMVVGFWNLRNYTLLDREENMGEISMQRKFDTASMGISVFVHSIKNQLLSNRVLYKKVWRALEEDDPDLANLAEYAKMLESVNESMLGRMEELYKSVKSNYISLYPITAQEVVASGLERFHKKYPDVQVQVRMESQDLVLGDKDHLGEAIYNLLANGYEASQAGREMLEIFIHNDRLYVGFEVRDHGKGMSKLELRKIFDPFYTSKNTNNNWGMGLYYVRQIVKSHLGMLKVESQEGQGSRFFMMIPRYAPRKEGK